MALLVGVPSPVLSPEIAHAEVLDIDQLITLSSTKEGINREHFYKTLECESAGFTDVAIQSYVPDPTGPNGREDSWGLAQIHLPDHPDVSREMAQNPSFAIPYAAHLFKENPHYFHCYDKELKKGWK